MWETVGTRHSPEMVKMENRPAVSLLCCLLIVIYYRQAAVLSKGAWSDLDPRRALAALEFATLHHPDNLLNCGMIEPKGHDLFHTLILFDVGLQDWVQYGVGRKAVRVQLVGP